MVGIENLKQDLASLAKMVSKLDGALEDGKVSVGEGIGIAFSAIDLIKVAKTVKAAYEELVDLDDPERVELVAYFKEVFDLRDDKAEEVVESIVELALTLADSLSLLGGE